MKKICYITTISTTIKAFFVPQLEYLSQNGYDVTVICSPDEKLRNKLNDNIHYIPIHIDRGIKPHTLLKSTFSLAKVLRENKFNLVQYSTPNAAFCASIAAKIAGIKIRNYHLMGLRYLGMSGVSRKIFKIIEKLTCKLSTHIECITDSNMNLGIEEKLFKPQKATMVWHGSSGGIDTTRFNYEKRSEWRKEIRDQFLLSENDFVFGFVGRITRDKGINEMLEAFFELDGDAKLLIIGDKEGIGTLNEDLWKRAANSENIIITNFVNDIERYYPAMDMLLLPSYREGFGMVIAEAAAVGTPSIVSNIPGPIDVIKENETAFVAEVKSVESLCEKMQYSLDNPMLCKSMSQECVTYIDKKFNHAKLNEKILERKDMLLAEERI